MPPAAVSISSGTAAQVVETIALLSAALGTVSDALEVNSACGAAIATAAADITSPLVAPG